VGLYFARREISKKAEVGSDICRKKDQNTQSVHGSLLRLLRFFVADIFALGLQAVCTKAIIY
jgi:hypothetical protein